MLRSLPFFLAGFVFLGAATAAEPTPAELLEKAIYAEQALGDLDQAAGCYRKIADDPESERETAARAQFRLGLTHLRRGNRAAAAKEFQTLIEKYPEQKRLVAQARNLMPPVVSEAIERIRSNYVDALEDEDELMAAAIRGMLQHLDPHSDFISAESMENFRVNISGELVGIGVAIGITDGHLVVNNPILGSPAFKAGVRSGDRIVAIDGRATADIPADDLLKEAIRLLRGKAGTAVAVGVLSPDADEPRDLEVIRGKIKLNSVAGDTRDKDGNWTYVLGDKPKIGYVRILTFSRDTPEDFGAAIGALQRQGVEALIIDLRNNGGGLMQSTVAVADLFLKEGVIVDIKGRNDQRTTLRATPEQILDGVPIAILENSMTASAAEILAGALRDHQRAVVVGERTFGKGTVQSLFELRSGSAIKLTTARFYLPGGTSLQRPPNAEDDDEWGVMPSEGLAVALTEKEAREYSTYRSARDRLGVGGDDVAAFEDRVLEKAVDYLTEKLAE